MPLKSLLLIFYTSIFLASSSVLKGKRFNEVNFCNVAKGEAKGNINDGHITEASGLAYSRRSEQVLWINNDSGGVNRIYAVSEHGRKLAEVWLEGTTVRDWEDVAVNVEDGVSYLYLADTGDNGYSRSSLTIYKFAEPAISHDSGQVLTIGADSIEHIHVFYPDNKRYDCEAMAIDPQNHDILLFTKDHHDWKSHVFRVPHGNSDPKQLEQITQLPYKLVTGASISPSGGTLALTSVLEDFGWSWSNPGAQAWADILKAGQTEPCQLDLKFVPQREAIAVTESGYWTTSEGKNQPLYYFRNN